MRNTITSITPDCAKKLLDLASKNRTKKVDSAVQDGHLRMKAIQKAKTISLR